MFLKCTQAYCHSNGTYENPVAMTTRYILNISRSHDDGIYLTTIVMTTGYIRYIHLWFPLILSVKVVYIYIYIIYITYIYILYRVSHLLSTVPIIERINLRSKCINIRLHQMNLAAHSSFTSGTLCITIQSFKR